jgi:hypothetical protein
METLIAMTVGTVVGGAAVWFIVEGTRVTLRTNASTTNDMAQWSISSRIQIDSRIANGAVIFPSLGDDDLRDVRRRRGGERGHVLVLSLSSRAPGATRSYYKSVIGYVYDPATRTLSKFEHEVAAAQQGVNPSTLETILLTNKAGFQMQVLAREVGSLDAAGPFVCRDIANVNAATATFQLEQRSSLWTSEKTLCEVSFQIRG